MKKEGSFSLKKLVTGVVAFLILAPGVIFLEVGVLGNLLPLLAINDSSLSLSSSKNFSYPEVYSAEQPLSSAQLKSNIVIGDARPVIIRNYLLFYHSPLLPYADLIFSVSQKYGLDYRLLVAIAQQESNLCKKIPPDSYNCWGWGIHSRGTLKFSSYPEAIETVARGLREEYLDKGFDTPEKIMKKYTPFSNGSWAAGVRQFMEEMENQF